MNISYEGFDEVSNSNDAQFGKGGAIDAIIKCEQAVCPERRRRWLIAARGWSAATTLGSESFFLSTLKGFASR